MRKLLAIVCVGLLPLGLVQAQDAAVKKEREKFQGEWKVASSEEDGRATADFIVDNLTIVIKGDQITVKGVEDLVERFGKVTFTIDPGTTPRVIDFKVVAGKEKDNRYEGIYELKDNQLKICATTRSGGDRPDEFKTAAGANRILFVLKREKK
jgi:uncharacterized protein (TIGR03067 family)